MKNMFLMLALLLLIACKSSEGTSKATPAELEAMGKKPVSELTAKELAKIVRVEGTTPEHVDIEDDGDPFMYFTDDDWYLTGKLGNKEQYEIFFSNQLTLYGRNEKGERRINAEELKQFNKQFWDPFVYFTDDYHYIFSKSIPKESLDEFFSNQLELYGRNKKGHRKILREDLIKFDN